MTLFYAGFNASSLFTEEEDIVIAMDQFTKVPFSDITNMEISWNYFLLWRDLELYIIGKVDNSDDKKAAELLKIPESSGSVGVKLLALERKA